MHRDANQEVAPTADGRTKTLALAADNDGDGAAEIGLARGQLRIPVGAHDAQTARVEVGEGTRQIVDGRKQHVLNRPGGCLDGGGCQRRLVARREDRTVHTGRLRSAQQGAHVLGVLERVQHKHERRSSGSRRVGQQVIECRPAAWRNHQRDALMPVKPGHGGQRPALHFNHRDPEARGMQDEFLERHSALRDNQQPDRLAAGDKRLFNRSSTGNELLVIAKGERRVSDDSRPNGDPLPARALDGAAKPRTIAKSGTILPERSATGTCPIKAGSLKARRLRDRGGVTVTAAAEVRLEVGLEARCGVRLRDITRLPRRPAIRHFRRFVKRGTVVAGGPLPIPGPTLRAVVATLPRAGLLRAVVPRAGLLRAVLSRAVVATLPRAGRTGTGGVRPRTAELRSRAARIRARSFGPRAPHITRRIASEAEAAGCGASGTGRALMARATVAG